MDKKKILFVSPMVYPQRMGGIEVFNYYLIQELGNDYDVTYLNVDTKSDIIELKSTKRVTIRDTSQLIQLFQIVFYLIKARKSYDLICTSFSRTAWYYIIIYPIINLLLSKEYIIVIHGGGMMPWRFNFPYQYYFRKAKTIIGVSDTICKEYNKRTGIKIIHIPPLIPFRESLDTKEGLRKKYRIDMNMKVFLFVGSLKELKCPDVILKAFVDFGRDSMIKHNTLMVFAGDGYMKEALIQYCKNNKIEDFIVFKGNVPRDKINELYKLSDYYIISSDFEGTPISMLEAMFNKLPILASDVRGINSVIDKDKGILFDNQNVKSLVTGIQRVLIDDALVKSISENSYTYYNKNFEYKNMIDKYKSIV